MMAFQTNLPGTNRTVIKHKEYGEDGWNTDESFSPYFYVDGSEGYRLPDGVDGRVERSVPERAYDGTGLHKVFVANTRAVSEARSEADNHFEADIPFERRWFIDNVAGSLAGEGDIPDERPHIMHIDIEVGTDGLGRPDPMEASRPVVSVSLYSERADRHIDLLLKPDGWEPAGDGWETKTDDDGREFVDPGWDGPDGSVYVFDNEVELLGTLASVLDRTNVEVLTGWNVEGFDIAYLITRMSSLNGIHESLLSPLAECYTSEWYTDSGERRIKAVIKGIDVFGMMDAYKHLKRRDKPPNWKLETVAEYESGVEVGKVPFDNSRVSEAWRDDPMEVMRYNRRDALLTDRVAGALNVFDLFLEMQRAFAMPLPDTLKNSVLVEMYVMSRAPDWGITDRVLDSKRTDESTAEGGNTRQPEPGRYEWAFSVDVTSEYPNWVRAANISPETIVTPGDDAWGMGHCIDTPVDGVRFLPHSERLGILPRAVDEMFEMKKQKTEERARHKYGTDAYEQADLERDATKWFLNSIQGVTGMETHRLSKGEVCDAITAFGRETVDFMDRVGSSMGYEFIYADTDSAFFHDPDGGISSTEEVVEATKGLQKEVNERLPEWANEAYSVPLSEASVLRVEPDKVAKRAFFPNKKKRYTLWLDWDDGDDVDKITHTGWAIVRSDCSEAVEAVQRKVLEAIMHNRDEQYITDRLREEMMRVVDGDYEPLELARPQGSSKRFERYGDNDGVADFENVPYFVAAMMSANELLGTDHRGGDKAYMLPVEETKTVRAGETTNSVNYLAIDADTELPGWVEIDHKKALDNILGKVERIYESLEWDFEALRDHRDDALRRSDTNKKQNNHRTLTQFTS